MDEHDEGLRRVLGEWRAPETPASLDARVMASYRRHTSPPWWRRVFAAKIAVPVPVFAAVLVLLAAALWVTRATPPERRVAPVMEPAVVVTSFDEPGFRPLPKGEIRVLRKGVEQ